MKKIIRQLKAKDYPSERTFVRADRLKTSFGFTLIETIIALAIFSASIVGLVSVTASGVANTNFAKNKLTASYLAQEGIELVRNMRDTELISPTGDWVSFTTAVASCLSSGGCYIDPTDAFLSATLCTGLQVQQNPDGCPTLDYSQFGFYNYGSGITSIFTRIITVQELNLGVEVRVTSTILWQQGRANKRVIMTENLFNWIQ